ncbi:Hypothetical protein SMAX5B_004481 [Scophthalmus maximus]|uniref:Uncharacterized protein n=1 Tax=Scophthalmus maximus TaxID=52904 RepID=A0A2U9B016_SCOMX|nr:Hypothetical protein SMAX5B_004481 [Scophthalmus maximus]
MRNSSRLPCRPHSSVGGTVTDRKCARRFAFNAGRRYGTDKKESFCSADGRRNRSNPRCVVS